MKLATDIIIIYSYSEYIFEKKTSNLKQYTETP